MKKFLMGIGLLAAVPFLVACGPQKNVSPDAVMPQHTADTSKFIGEEKAKEIALDRAEISADGVKFDRVELDRDEGVWQYEIDFRHGNDEYDVDINAETGEVMGYEKEAY